MRVLKWAAATVALLLLVVVAGLIAIGLPQFGAGMAAKGVCSALFVAGRAADHILEQEVLPASALLLPVHITIDKANHTVTATYAGVVSRRAALLRDRGCVLDVEPDPGAVAYVPAVNAAALWPQGDAALPVGQWGTGVDAAALQAAVDGAFVGAGDPDGANARGIAVVHRGRLLMAREAPGFAPGTPLHGWSMTKTVNAMLVHKLAAEAGLPLDAAVVDAFPPGRTPAWVEPWRTDGRKAIKVSDLLYMRDGLDSVEDYNPWGSVPIMLWREPDVAAWAAHYPPAAAPATRWRYLSASANLLSAVARGRFANDAEYWAYPRNALFDPIGARSATLESDPAGNWVGSSFLWASIQDWARLGQLTLQDGAWEGRAVLPPGWLARASSPALAQGEGEAYGAQTWLFGNRAHGQCKNYLGVPEDAVAMGGHWGQMVVAVPSLQAVVVRLGWIHGAYDECQLLESILKTLPK